jgi:hypothetical protein
LPPVAPGRCSGSSGSRGKGGVVSRGRGRRSAATAAATVAAQGQRRSSRSWVRRPDPVRRPAMASSRRRSVLGSATRSGPVSNSVWVQVIRSGSAARSVRPRRRRRAVRRRRRRPGPRRLRGPVWGAGGSCQVLCNALLVWFRGRFGDAAGLRRTPPQRSLPKSHIACAQLRHAMEHSYRHPGPRTATTLSCAEPEMALINFRCAYRCLRQSCSARMGFLASRFTTFQQRPGVNRAFPVTRAIQVRLSSAEEQHG